MTSWDELTWDEKVRELCLLSLWWSHLTRAQRRAWVQGNMA